MTATLAGSDIAHLRHELRTPVNQIVGYCEMLLEDADDPSLAHRREPLNAALVAVREITSLIDQTLPSAALSISEGQIVGLYESMHAPRSRIIEAMTTLLHDATAAPPEFIADVCRIRDATERLLPTDRARRDMMTMYAVPAAVTVAAENPGGSVTPGAHVLVVDDVEENRAVLERRLTREGHTVVCAENGVDALAKVAATPFDVILLDIMMPEMDGHETLRRLKSDDATREIPVIMISALDDIASIVSCIEAGADDYLPKPFDPVLLRARISASLQKKEARDRERRFLADVKLVSAAAADVERGAYEGGSLSSVGARGDELGTLARVFDTMASGVRRREERLRHQVARLREEIAGISDAPIAGGESQTTLQSGEIIADRYTIERPIGAGGMGMVYLAADRELGERVAMKTLHPELLAQGETAIERFRNEIRLARRISHRNIVRTHDFGRWGELSFVTMEFIEGTTLRAVIDQRGTLGVAAVIAIARQLADALASAHDLGIVHRDIKPQNVLLDANGSLKVMDFGVARLVESKSRLTSAGILIGTPTYMSPEQLLDEEVDARSDLYSMGVLLYECLTGRPPFEARSPVALIGRILQGDPAPPERIAPDIPRGLSALVMRLLATSPSDRVQSASQLGDVLVGIA